MTHVIMRAGRSEPLLTAVAALAEGGVNVRLSLAGCADGCLLFRMSFCAECEEIRVVSSLLATPTQRCRGGG